MMKAKALPGSEGGFSLVEVTLALGVAGFCLVSLFGLLPIGLNSNRNSVEQTAAASAAASVIADLRSASSTANSPQFGIPVPAAAAGSQMYTLFLREDGTWAAPAGTALPTGTGSGSDAVISENPRYRVTLNFVPPSAAGLRLATSVRVLVTWPAVADPKAATVPSRFNGAFETVTALDRG